jgi:hypothetical protein
MKGGLLAALLHCFELLVYLNVAFGQCAVIGKRCAVRSHARTIVTAWLTCVGELGDQAIPI